jgi:hypothetical protein
VTNAFGKAVTARVQATFAGNSQGNPLANGTPARRRRVLPLIGAKCCFSTNWHSSPAL